MKRTSTGLIPEQVWNTSTTLTEDWVTTTPAGYTPGAPTKSMAPLSWAMGEYISLIASIHNNKIVDILPQVCDRYHTCTVPPPAGEVARPSTQQRRRSTGSRCT